ncbi:hypothetical protein ACFQ08_08960 [Streptosporangium algeriense]|uniref:Major facilitator superfamily (MFS) profile domain-containing protein n=1 Tax=Streptosporangium algeriense TaxID=1682748 RepID=A0ABW3DLC0_9ACTN
MSVIDTASRTGGRASSVAAALLLPLVGRVPVMAAPCRMHASIDRITVSLADWTREVGLETPVLVVGFSLVVTAVTGGMAYVPGGLPLGLLFGLAAFLAPAANTTVLTYQLLAAPEGMRGRLSGISGLSSGIAGVVGPAVGSAVVSLTAGPLTFLVCAGGFALVALITVLSPSLRRFPSLDTVHSS